MAEISQSFGAFVSIGQLALTIYQRCRASVVEFKDLSKEVISMHIVLQEIEQYWKEQEARGQDLSTKQKTELKELAGSCEEALRDLEALLEKHQDLGKEKTFIARMKWVMKDIAPLRNSLIARTTLLSTFNCIITATSNANAQARLLEALNIIHRDYENGDTRRVPAFSQATAEDLEKADSEAWRSIATELETRRIPTSVVRENQPFVRSWIAQVILEEYEDWSEEDEDSSDSAIYQPSGTPPQGGTTRSSIISPSLDAIGQPESSQSVKSLSRERLLNNVEGSDPRWIQNLLSTFLLSDESFDKYSDFIKNGAKWTYRRIDQDGRGSIRRFDVQDEFRQALQCNKVPVTEPELIKLISLGDRNHSGRINMTSFQGLIPELLGLVDRVTEKFLDQSISDHIGSAKQQYLGIIVPSILTPAPSILPLPWGWEEGWAEVLHNHSVVALTYHQPVATSVPGWMFGHGLGLYINSRIRPMELLSFGTIYTAVTDVCIPVIGRTIKQWSEALTSLPPEQFDEYHTPMEAVLDAASRFFLLGPLEQSQVQGNELDDFITLTQMDPFYGGDKSVQSPLTELKRLRDESNDILHSILAFMVAMGINNIHYVYHNREISVPPQLEVWRGKFMHKRAQRIAKASECIINARSLIEKCKAWIGEHPALETDVIHRLQRVIEMREEQIIHKESLLRKEYELKLKKLNEVAITIVSASNLPTRGKLRLFPDRPTTSVHISRQIASGWPTRRVETNYDIKSTPHVYITSWSEPIQNTNHPNWNHEVRWLLSADTKINVTVYFHRVPTLNSPKRYDSEVAEAIISIQDAVDLGKFQSQTISVPLQRRRKQETRPFPSTSTPTITLRFEPQPLREYFPVPRVVKNVDELMRSTCDLETPIGWKKKSTADGRIYFSKATDAEATTIAYNLDGEIKGSHTIPEFAKLFPKPVAGDAEIFWPDHHVQ